MPRSIRRARALFLLAGAVVVTACTAVAPPPAELRSLGGVAGVPVIGPAVFACEHTGGRMESLTATFYGTEPGLVLLERGGQTRPAFQVIAASGARYEGRVVMFWEARGTAAVVWSGAELSCRRQRLSP